MALSQKQKESHTLTERRGRSSTPYSPFSSKSPFSPKSPLSMGTLCFAITYSPDFDKFSPFPPLRAFLHISGPVTTSCKVLKLVIRPKTGESGSDKAQVGECFFYSELGRENQKVKLSIAFAVIIYRMISMVQYWQRIFRLGIANMKLSNGVHNRPKI